MFRFALGVAVSIRRLLTIANSLAKICRDRECDCERFIGLAGLKKLNILGDSHRNLVRGPVTPSNVNASTIEDAGHHLDLTRQLERSPWIRAEQCPVDLFSLSFVCRRYDARDVRRPGCRPTELQMNTDELPARDLHLRGLASDRPIERAIITAPLAPKLTPRRCFVRSLSHWPNRQSLTR